MKEYKIVVLDCDAAVVNKAAREGWAVHSVLTSTTFAPECLMERDVPEAKPAEEPRLRVGARVQVIRDPPNEYYTGTVVGKRDDGEEGFMVYFPRLRMACNVCREDLTPLEDEP